ncbi:MAG: acetate kinase [Pontimonas sp.]|jgi:acetate kinase
MVNILVINAGSSTIKWQVVDPESGESSHSGLVEGLGNSPSGEDYRDALLTILDSLPQDLELSAVGHRVVHGGEEFGAPVLITDEIERAIEALSPLAPLHNPANLAGIRAARGALADIPHVGVFDTAFHQGLPKAASTLAIPQDLAKEHGIRKYGFHGTSHQFVTRAASKMLGGDSRAHRIVSLHLGNGSSAAAVKGGKCLDTSMGFTPLQGLVMGTRSGDLDPAVVLYLQRNTQLTTDAIDELLNKKSGLLGLSGSADFRDVSERALSGEDDAHLALEIWGWRIRHYVGAYAALMGGLDAVVFTGGIGENSSLGRMEATKGLAFLGIQIDENLNTSGDKNARDISAPGATVKILVIPTNEEWEIARETAWAISSSR